MQAVGTGLAGQQVRGEERGFQQEVAGAGAHRRRFATHNAGDGQWARVIGNHQGFRLQFHRLAIE